MSAPGGTSRLLAPSARDLAAEIGLWFLLRPETYWQRTATVFFGTVLLAFIGWVLYFYGRNIAVKPDVSAGG